MFNNALWGALMHTNSHLVNKLRKVTTGSSLFLWEMSGSQCGSSLASWIMRWYPYLLNECRLKLSWEQLHTGRQMICEALPGRNTTLWRGQDKAADDLVKELGWLKVEGWGLPCLQSLRGALPAPGLWRHLPVPFSVRCHITLSRVEGLMLTDLMVAYLWCKLLKPPTAISFSTLPV